MAGTSDVGRTSGSLSAAVSSAIGQLTAQCTGRGPTRTRTTISDDLIVVLMEGILTKGERSLLASGQGEFGLATRRQVEDTMRDDFVSAVEMLTRRRVIAYMASSHMDPDMGAAIFVLEPRSRVVAAGEERPTP